MKLRTSLFALGLAVAAHAQNSLPVLPTGNAFIWVPPQTAGQTYFNLTVATTVTIQGLEFDCVSPPETTGSIQLWLTNPGTTTHVGNETNPAVWSQVASGPVVMPPAPTDPTVCFTTGVVLQPGTYGVAVRYVNLGQIFVQGNGTNQTFSNTELSVSAGSVTSGPFNGTFATPYVFRGTIFYANGAVPHTCATDTEYGKGCYTTAGSFFQQFTAASATAAALNGRSLTMLFTGTGYTVLPGISVTYIPPTAAATVLTLADDAETQVALPSPFVHPAGAATQLFVHSNGYVSLGTNNAVPGTNNWTPTPGGLLSVANAIYAVAWHDFNPTEAGSGQIKTELVGTNLFCITWDNVESYPTTAVNPGRCQIQFDLSSGSVNYVWQSLAAVGGSAEFDGTLIGYSPDGLSPRPDPIDIATLSFVNLTTPEVFPLTLAASTSPELGATVDLTTSNEGILNVGVLFLSAVQIPAPGIDLGILGAPGCAALMDINAAFGSLISNLGVPFPSMVLSLTIPSTPSLAGAALFGQSIWLDPAANAFGIKTSNGVALTVGTFGF